MVLLEPTISLGVIDLCFWQEHLLGTMGDVSELGYLLAQNIENPDIIAKFQKSFRNFIESGQVWALGIGFVLGYMFRTFTSS